MNALASECTFLSIFPLPPLMIGQITVGKFSGHKRASACLSLARLGLERRRDPSRAGRLSGHSLRLGDSRPLGGGQMNSLAGSHTHAGRRAARACAGPV